MRQVDDKLEELWGRGSALEKERVLGAVRQSRKTILKRDCNSSIVFCSTLSDGISRNGGSHGGIGRSSTEAARKIGLQGTH